MNNGQQQQVQVGAVAKSKNGTCLEMENDKQKFMASLNGDGGGTITADAHDNDNGDWRKGIGQENEENYEEDLQKYFDQEEDVVCIGEKVSVDAKYFSRILNLIQTSIIEKKPAVAEFICTKIFAELMEKYGRNHRNLAVYHDLLAKAYSIQGHYSRSQTELEELLQIHEQNNNQRGIAYALYAKTICYTMEKKYEEAIQECHKAFVIYKEIHGTEEHPNVGKLLYYQALIYHRRALSGSSVDFNEVQRTYKRALAILEATLGNEHKRTMDCRNKLAKLTETAGNQQQQEKNVLNTSPNKESGIQQHAVITLD